MARTPTTFLFGDDRIAAATGERGRYRHTFGGPHDRKGRRARTDCDGWCGVLDTEVGELEPLRCGAAGGEPG
jgi:hypothetical protein